jgi:hypothetical protein
MCGGSQPTMRSGMDGVVIATILSVNKRSNTATTEAILLRAYPMTHDGRHGTARRRFEQFVDANEGDREVFLNETSWGETVKRVGTPSRMETYICVASNVVCWLLFLQVE